MLIQAIENKGKGKEALFLTDEIRNYQITTSLPADKIKYSREYQVLAILKYAFGKEYACLHKGESPDLQDSEGNIGIEVTWGGSPIAEKISGESVKYSHAQTPAEREKCLGVIRKNGGDRDEVSTSYPVETVESEKVCISNVLRKKIRKANNYHERCQRIGLAIMLDIPLIFFSDLKWGEWLAEENKGSFDFIVLTHWSGVDSYDFLTKEYSSHRISRDDMDSLKKLARMTAEGIISDDSSVWNFGEVEC